jgi:hypothetical protein
MPQIRHKRDIREDFGEYLENMDKLNLPKVKLPLSAQKSLSMDEYLEFIDFNLKYTVDKKASRSWKKTLFVNVPFCLKDEN